MTTHDSGVAVPDESQLLKAARRVVETRDMLFWSDARIDAMRGLEEAVAASGVPACEAPDLHALIDRLDGYLNSPEQIALRDDLLAALRALGVGGTDGR